MCVQLLAPVDNVNNLLRALTHMRVSTIYHMDRQFLCNIASTCRLSYPGWPPLSTTGVKKFTCLLFHLLYTCILKLYINSDYKLKINMSIAGIPLGKSDASGGIGPRHIVTSTSGFSSRCRLMRPIFPVEFQLKSVIIYIILTAFLAFLP